MILSLSVHEWAHAFSAHKLGDDTAANEGRLTLDPLVHIDLVGTLLLPLLGIPFGWAKPVPVNPARFSRRFTMRTGMAITAAAGPLSNAILALLSAIGLGVYLHSTQGVGSLHNVVFVTLRYAIQLNIGLTLLNLIPIPPLDGSRIVARMVAYRYPNAWELVEKYGSYLLVLVFATSGVLLSAPRAYLDNAITSAICSAIGYPLQVVY